MVEKQKTTILVVDDEKDARETIAELLELDGYKVKTTDSGDGAIEILKKQNFDIIITDLFMDNVDGIELTKTVRKMGFDMPIIVMTGFATIERAVESIKAGAWEFINKPFHNDQIRLTVEKTLATKKLQKLADKSDYYKKLSNIDELTGLSNYRFFIETLKSELRRADRYNRPLSLLMLDIDDFKTFNDKYGHLTGDAILKEVAALFQKNIRGCDTAARYGGEEFTIIIPETNDQEAYNMAERIRQSIFENEFEIQPGSTETVNISITIGIAAFPKDAKSEKALIDAADKALYRGKAEGKNKVVKFSA